MVARLKGLRAAAAAVLVAIGALPHHGHADDAPGDLVALELPERQTVVRPNGIVVHAGVASGIGTAFDATVEIG
jgi:hypothetical protein